MPTTRTVRARLLLGVAVPTLLLLAACGGEDPPLDTTPTAESSDASSGPTYDGSVESPSPTGASTTATGTAGTYVALGDSFAAAPLVPETDPADGCQRSTGNYARLVAADASYELTDVTCIGASTTSMIGAQQNGSSTALPQFDALDRTTALVTLTVGGNDFDVFSQLLLACLPQQSSGKQTSCRQNLAASGNGQLILDNIAKIRDRVAATTRGIRDRAPKATVVVADYPQLLPDRGSCPDLVPLSARDYGYVTELNRALSTAVREGGKAGGAKVVNVFKASQGHDICSDEPWVNGVQTDPERALALHPFAEEQRAVADLVLGALGR